MPLRSDDLNAHVEQTECPMSRARRTVALGHLSPEPGATPQKPMSYQEPVELPRHVPVPKKAMSGCAIAAIGCGVFMLIMIIVAVGAAWWVSRNLKQFGTDIAVSAMKEGLAQVEVPDDQRQRMYARIDDVAQQFKDGELTLEQVGSIFESIGDGPLLSTGIALVVKRAYIRDSGLSQTEKADGDITIQRFARGAVDETISKETRESVISLISTRNAQGQYSFKGELTDEELRTFLEAAKKAADDAEVPNEVPKINFADEFDKAIDKALGEIKAAKSGS